MTPRVGITVGGSEFGINDGNTVVGLSIGSELGVNVGLPRT